MDQLFEKAKKIIKEHGGMLRTNEAMKAGIHPRTLYGMRDQAILEQVARGLFRLSEYPPLGNPDLTVIGQKLSGVVICLVSALSFHELTTQIPREIHLAVKRESRSPVLDYPPIKVYRFSGKAFSEGIETHDIEGTSVRIYSPEKTLADCFKYRNKLGMDVVLEALKIYKERRKRKIDELFHYARICRVEWIMRPYMEALL